MEALKSSKLPANFEKYNEIIMYFKNNGIDITTLQEQFRFFIRYIYDSSRSSIDFDNQLEFKTSLSTKGNARWGRWFDSDIDGYDYYHIEEFKFNMKGYDFTLINDEFLYKQLSKATDDVIMKYFNELYQYGKLNELPIVKKYITITNKFNDSKILIEKDNFKKYCAYDHFLNFYQDISNEKIQTFSIDVEFNDEVANNIEQLLNHNNMVVLKNLESMKQQFAVIDFLQINMKYL